MANQLAIVLPRIGSPSEQFLRRHFEQLAPGRTVGVAVSRHGDAKTRWQVPVPLLVLEETRPDPVRRVWAAARRAVGRQVNQYEAFDVPRWWREQGVNVILGEYLDFSLPWFELARRAGIEFVAHGHGYDFSMRLRKPEWREQYRIYNQARAVVVPSEHAQRRLITCGLDTAKIHVISYGVELPEEAASNKPADGLVRVLAVGRMVAKKAPLLTLRAFERAVRDRPELRLDYIGAGDLLDEARRFVTERELTQVVTLHGAAPHQAVLEKMRGADVFMQHSVVDPHTADEEGMPVAILEAMAYGLPIISTRHAGIPEAVREGEEGLLVNEGDWEGMADNLLELASGIGLRQRMGQAGRERIARNYKVEDQAEKLRRVLGLV